APWPEGCRPHLLIVGAGPEESALRSEADRREGLGVTFTGHLEDLRPAYSAMDAFALSSDSEQQPVSLLEAMAAGRPVAATDVGDIAATLPPEARVGVVPLGPAVEDHLGGALAALASDPARAATLGAAGRARVARDFSLDAMVERYRDVYESAMAR
ncbi:MAG: glycosyltransferase, partial [Planctomycetota bacterium]|nr:glycosyltransferase [Planctomycetota bacterium]